MKKNNRKTHRTKKQKAPKKQHHFCRSFLFILFVVCCTWGGIHYLTPHKQCLFYRAGQCITCDTEQDFPAGYKENCENCINKKAHYVEGGIVSAWLCLTNEQEPEIEPILKRDTTPCPDFMPLKDIVGNCYSCDTKEPVRLIPSQKHFPCQENRYILPDDLTLKSLICPTLEDIHDPEVCISCHGVWQGESCTNKGKNIFCETNEDCPQNQWCFPFKIERSQKGICSNLPETKWICSQTDGYDLQTTQAFCAGQKAHIPTLEEIGQANENLAELCPTLDMWTFFAPDGVVWLESFTQEFLFTREGESEKLGGHSFYALCHKD